MPVSSLCWKHPQAVAFPHTVPELLRAAVLRAPDALAINLFEQAVTITFAELGSRVKQLAHGLSQIGVGFGTHVAVALPNILEFPVTWLALAELGAVMVPLVLSSTKREIEFFLTDSDSRYLVTTPAYLEDRGLVAGENGVPVPNRIITTGDTRVYGPTIAELIASGHPDFAPDRLPDKVSLLNIQYTSGTTGLPKGAMLSHRYWIVIGAGMCEFFDRRFGALYSASPFFYMDSQAMLMSSIYCAGRLDLADRPTIRNFVSHLATLGSDGAWLVDQVLKEKPDEQERDIRLKVQFGYHLSPSIIAQAEKRFRAPAREMYGSTEVGLAIAVPIVIENASVIGSCGVAAPLRSLRIVREDGSEAAPGEIGELLVAGDGLFDGYYNRDDTNAELLVDGWFRTGDLFIRDDDGFYWIVGRTKDMVRRSEENISAIEVELVLREINAIADAAVVAVPDAARGEEVKAYLLPVAGSRPPSIEAVLDHCRRRLAPFKWPRYVQFVDQLPYTASEKVAKKELTAGVEDLRIGAWDTVDQLQR